MIYQEEEHKWSPLIYCNISHGRCDEIINLILDLWNEVKEDVGMRGIDQD